MEKVLIIYNAKSGGGKARKVLIKLKSFLDNSHIEFLEYLTKKRFDTDGIFKAFDGYKPTLVVTCGGDGTAHDTVNALLPTNIPFLILPAGSGNDFATMLYGQQKTETLFPKIKNPMTRQVDLGICNGRYFLNGIGLGFDGAIARQTQQNKSGLLPTRLKYYLAILKNILRFRSFYCLITRNEKTLRVKTFMIAVANGPYYGGGFKIAPKATIQDGLLDIVHIGEMTTIKRPFYIPKVKRGKHLHLPFVQHEQLREVKFYSVDGESIPAHADGEDITASYFEAGVKAGALCVLV